jgi:5'(3')-deoxyribonucleotidase
VTSDDLRKLIYCDVDSTLALLDEKWLRLYNEEYNDNLTHNDLKSWSIHQFVKPECGLNMYKYLDLPGLYDDIKVVPGALEGVETLRRLGFHIKFLTSGFNTEKFRWLQNNGFLPMDKREGEKDFIISSEKGLFQGFCLIDDAIHNVQAFTGYSVLLDNPWNQGFEFKYRAMGWEDVPYYVGLLFERDKRYTR